MVAQAIQSVISMLILMLIGAWLAGKDWFRKSVGTGLLSKLIVNVLVPLYMLNNVLTKVGTRQKLWEIVVCLPLPMITIFISLALGIWMAGRLGIHAPRRGVFINVMTFTNCVLVGFPIIISLFGEEAAAVGMVYYMVNTICFWTIGVQLLREDGGQKSSLFSKAGLKKLLSPPLLGFLLGVVLVYLIMVAQFQSLKSPFIVMFTIPLAFTGGFLALLVSGIEVSVVSLIGFVMLVGVIVNNGIVLVDYINQQRQDGMARREAIIDAGVTRLRPILMTSLTTILGLVVTALAKNAGTALIQPIALVCIGGLLYATLMTLFVVPCMYDMMNKKELRKVDDSELELLDI